VEAQAALVGAERAVELHAVAAVHAHVAGVVEPGHAEHDHAFRLDEALEDRLLAVGRVAREHRLDRLEHLVHGLQKLVLARMDAAGTFHHVGGIAIHRRCSSGLQKHSFWFRLP
jgi:hypothetical protein